MRERRAQEAAIGGAANGPGNIALLNRLVVTNYYTTPSKGVYWHTGSKVSPSLGKYPEAKKPMHRINIMEWERKVTDIAAAYEAMVPDPFLDAMNNRYVKMFWEKLVNSTNDLVVRELSNARCMYRGLPNETASLLLRAANTPITIGKMNDGLGLVNSGLLLRIPPIPQYRKTKGTLNLSGLRVLMNWAERPDFKRFFDCFIPDPIELERTIMSNQVEAKMKTGFWADDWR